MRVSSYLRVCMQHTLRLIASETEYARVGVFAIVRTRRSVRGRETNPSHPHTHTEMMMMMRLEEEHAMCHVSCEQAPVTLGWLVFVRRRAPSLKLTTPSSRTMRPVWAASTSSG